MLNVTIYICKAKYLIIIVNRFRYINNNATKKRHSKFMDMTIMLDPKLAGYLKHHGSSMYSSHYTTVVNCCKNILLQRQQNYRVWNDWYIHWVIHSLLTNIYKYLHTVIGVYIHVTCPHIAQTTIFLLRICNIDILIAQSSGCHAVGSG